MEKREFRYHRTYAFFTLFAWIGVLALVIYLIMTYAPVPPESIPLTLLVFYLPVLIYRTVKWRIIPALKKETVLAMNALGLHLKQLYIPIRWSQIESVRGVRVGFVFEFILITFKNPDWILEIHNSWILRWKFRLNSLFNCNLMLFPRSFYKGSHELLPTLTSLLPNPDHYSIPEMPEIIAKIKDNTGAFGIALTYGATETEIIDFEKALNLHLPEDIKEFYRFSNGFVSPNNNFEILQLNSIIDRRNDEILKPGAFQIATHMDFCFSWIIVVNEGNYSIYDGSAHTKLTDSFGEFLYRYLSYGVSEPDGIYDWADDIREPEINVGDFEVG
jgi:hypothetical protein